MLTATGSGCSVRAFIIGRGGTLYKKHVYGQDGVLITDYSDPISGLIAQRRVYGPMLAVQGLHFCTPTWGFPKIGGPNRVPQIVGSLLQKPKDEVPFFVGTSHMNEQETAQSFVSKTQPRSSARCRKLVLFTLAAGFLGHGLLRSGSSAQFR